MIPPIDNAVVGQTALSQVAEPRRPGPGPIISGRPIRKMRLLSGISGFVNPRSTAALFSSLLNCWSGSTGATNPPGTAY